MCTVCLFHAVPFLSFVWQVLQSCSSTHCWTIHSASSAVPFPVLFFFHGTVKKEKPASISYATCGSVQNSVLIKYYNRIKGKKSVKRNIFFVNTDMPYCWLQQRPKAIFSFQLLNNNGQDSMEKLAGNLGLGSEFIELSILTTLFLYFLHKGLGDIRSRSLEGLAKWGLCQWWYTEDIKMCQSWHAISLVADI